MIGKGGKLGVTVLKAGYIGKAQLVSPFDQLGTRRREGAHGAYRAVTAPHNDAVRHGGHFLHGVHVGRGGVKDVDKGRETRLNGDQLIQNFDRQPIVGLG